MRKTLARSWGFLLLFGLTGAGCSTSSEKIRLTESGAPDFQRLEIVYDVNAAGSLASLNEPGSVRTASLADAGHADAAPNTRLRLEIQYPYPGIHEDFVHATLRMIPAGAQILNVQSAPPPGLRGFSNANSRGGGLMGMTAGPPVNHGPAAGEECLVIDLPKTELSALFVDLANDGFFQSAGVKGGESHLEVTYNQGQVNKIWNREPHLDQLVELLRRHGTPSVAEQPSGPVPGYYTGRNGKS